VRIWVDCTNSPHVLVFAPLVRRLREQGHRVDVTCRDFAQTVGLAERHGLDAEVVGTHGGGGRSDKARAMADRSRELMRWARGRRLDAGLSHGSTDAPLVCRLRGVFHAAMFDYEHAIVQHSINGPFAHRFVLPEAIPPPAVVRYGITSRKLRRYPGLKEEYYLHDARLDPTAAVAELGLDAARVLVVVRTPPAVALYHRHGNDLFAAVLHRLGEEEGVTAVVLPRTPWQGDDIRGLGLPNLLVPEAAIDAQSLLAAADLAVSAGGTMNREAVVLGCPVYTTFAGRLGAVDAGLIREGRLRALESAADLTPAKRPAGAPPRTRDPQRLLDLLLGGGRGRRGDVTYG
jgi:hypothetical protein